MRSAAQTRHKKYAEIDAGTGRARGFATPTGKLEIYSSNFAQAGYPPLPVWRESTDSPVASAAAEQEYPLLLTFSRLVQFCNQHHRNIPRLRRQAPQPLIEIHPATAAGLNIRAGELVVLETKMGQVQLTTKLNSFLDSRVVSMQYGWWQACRGLDLPGYDPLAPDGANGNLLVSNDAADPMSSSIQHRGLRCRVRKIDTAVPTVEEQAHVPATWNQT
jgi:anaerobic selenocysteine-containing dehydrogenase